MLVHIHQAVQNDHLRAQGRLVDTTVGRRRRLALPRRGAAAVALRCAMRVQTHTRWRGWMMAVANERCGAADARGGQARLSAVQMPTRMRGGCGCALQQGAPVVVLCVKRTSA